MTSIIKKVFNDNTYYYAVKSARVNGKPRIVSQIYLGTADNIVEMKKQYESLPYTTHIPTPPQKKQLNFFIHTVSY